MDRAPPDLRRIVGAVLSNFVDGARFFGPQLHPAEEQIMRPLMQAVYSQQQDVTMDGEQIRAFRVAAQDVIKQLDTDLGTITGFRRKEIERVVEWMERSPVPVRLGPPWPERQRGAAVD